MGRNVLFILNPKAGKGKAKSVIKLIEENFPRSIAHTIGVFQTADEFNKLIGSIGSNGYTDVIAVGGDGTVNYIAKYLVGTSVALGIIPLGSGNGMARSLGISMDLKKAIEQIAEGKKVSIDHGLINDKIFVCTSGVGFDAHIGQLFASSAKRGLQSYVKIILKEIFSYKPQTYSLSFNNTEIKREAFLITVANAGQYGNDFYIAPQAMLNDGAFHVAIVKPFHFFGAIGLFIKVLAKKAHQSKYIETFVTNELTIKRSSKGPVHYDGEPDVMDETVTFKCVNKGLNVIVGKDLTVA